MAGKVIGGHGKDANVDTLFGGTIVVQSGLKWRKLIPERVSSWTLVSSDSSKFRAVGKAVAGAVAPRLLSRTTSDAVGAAIDATVKATHVVRVDWADGKQSLIKLSDDLFTHFALNLATQRAEDETPIVPVAPESQSPTVVEQAFSVVSGLAQKKIADKPKPDIAAQLTSLAALRDQGILTQEEFDAKKAEILARL
ncbi:SHOCT domain-containing protein [Microbacterium sorbitolivorans]|nr:SHOCT domain-containing protein [Microbacterium sorbitolivorans]